MSNPPLIFIKISESFANLFRFFTPEVNNPAIISIIPCPKANKNNINIAANKFLLIVANAIMPAKIGVEHGVPAKAKIIPNNIG